MTPNEQAALVIEQRLSGEQNGKTIARIVTDRLSNGFSEVGPEIRKITDDALAHVVKQLQKRHFWQVCYQTILELTPQRGLKLIKC
jgi:hypothetical protein